MSMVVNPGEVQAALREIKNVRENHATFMSSLNSLIEEDLPAAMIGNAANAFVQLHGDANSESGLFTVFSKLLAVYEATLSNALSTVVIDDEETSTRIRSVIS